MSTPEPTEAPVRTSTRRKRKRRPERHLTLVPDAPPLAVGPPRKTTKGRTFEPRPYSAEDIAKLLRACRQLDPRAGHAQRLAAERNYALIVLLWRTGLRISEALALELDDLDRHLGQVHVRRGKGGKRRISMMDDFG